MLPSVSLVPWESMAFTYNARVLVYDVDVILIGRTLPLSYLFYSVELVYI